MSIQIIQVGTLYRKRVTDLYSYVDVHETLFRN